MQILHQKLRPILQDRENGEVSYQEGSLWLAGAATYRSISRIILHLEGRKYGYRLPMMSPVRGLRQALSAFI